METPIKKEQQIFDPNKPYQLRDGRPARIVHTFRKGHHFVVLDDTDGWIVVFADGRYNTTGSDDSEYDLVNIPEKIEGWFNIYKAAHLYYTGNLHDTKENAEIMCNGNERDKRDVIARKFISFKEGEGLNDK